MSKNIKPDYIFEVSWEVCNKVGGIHTVISTKAKTLVEEFNDNYILIGPEVWRETHDNSEFIEDKYLYRSWRQRAESEGLRFKVGRWNISGSPVAILVDFTQYFAVKDTIFTDFWIQYKLDSLSGQWDYTEPALFGYAAAKVIDSFYKFNIAGRDKIITQFHEWMTGTGILYLKQHLPQAATIFTTHATAIARSIAGNGLPLYRNLNSYNAESLAQDFGIVSKQSLEKISANECDAFTTVSEITSRECKQFLNKEVDVVTTNGFEDSFVPNNENFEPKRKAARSVLLKVAECLCGYKLPKNSMLIANSGRYEFRNKGIDLFIDSLGQLNKDDSISDSVIAFILVPANNTGPRKDLLDCLNSNVCKTEHGNDYLTHSLHDADWDPVLHRIRENELNNNAEDKVKIIFVPCYLNGIDGIFNLEYYDLLIGFDLTVFPSYYEPWGYTPLESIAFHIPTVTTSLAGFGSWVEDNFKEHGQSIIVIERNDDNQDSIAEQIKNVFAQFLLLSSEQWINIREQAFTISRSGLWKNMIENYKKAYSIAIEKAQLRKDQYISKQIPEHDIFHASKNSKRVWNKVLIKSEIPERLLNLKKLSNNLWWSWNHEASKLFESVDAALWQEVNHNPSALMEMLTYEKLLELEKNESFLQQMDKVYDHFRTYMEAKKDNHDDLIAYFSMEFGLHDTIKIFSGGLGILAGDYLKEASDANKNIVGIGLLYRYGYFNQQLALSGEQLEFYSPQKFSMLPISAVRDENGKWIRIMLAFPGRTLYAKVWRAEIGRVNLYLLDTDIDENNESDRMITGQLYGGDWENRLKQELLLGIGGIRLLEAIKVQPKLYHCNEGHAAFTGLERLHQLVQNENLNFYEALEYVRSSSLFTTHTPVPAGHDAFTENMLRTYISYFPSRLNISWETFINLGKFNDDDPDEKFSMSVLAAKLSQEMNGVSRIHGRVSRQLFNQLWPAFYPDELYIGYVTNGVHYPTWADTKWKFLYEKTFGEGFYENQSDVNYWKKIHDVPDSEIWNIRQSLRKEMISVVKNKLTESMNRRQENPKAILTTIESFDDNALTIGFARRFATYKRAYLLFKNIERLAKIVNIPGKPVQFVFAGKAHPQDEAGQDMIKHIIEISRRPEFIGKITFVEGYNIELAKKLVRGVDVWLNTPTRPLEASGTSGEKAVMNGVLNFSVLDGWWAEGYKQNAGWALKEEQTYENPQFQDELDAETVYSIIENEIVPTFYDRNKNGIPEKWIKFIKNNISEIAPHFTMNRMINDYYNQFYNKLFERSVRIKENNYEMARNISAWKKKMKKGWESIEIVSVKIPDSTQKPLHLGEKFKAEIVLDMNELSTDDIAIEILFGQKVMDEVRELSYIYPLKPEIVNRTTVTYSTEILMPRSGVYDYAFRIFPTHPLLAHRQDFNLVKWL